MFPKRKFTLQEVIQMDQYLMQLASYEASRGMMRMPSSMEEFVSIQEETANNFKYFKRLIQTQECNFDELEQMVISRYGALPSANKTNTLNETLKEICEKKEDEEPTTEDLIIFSALMEGLRQSLPEGVIMLGPVSSQEHFNDFDSVPTPKTLEKKVTPKTKKVTPKTKKITSKITKDSNEVRNGKRTTRTKKAKDTTDN